MVKNKNALAPKKIEVMHSKEIELARKEASSVKTQVSVSEYTHRGPIPDPMTLKGYDDICSGLLIGSLSWPRIKPSIDRRWRKLLLNPEVAIVNWVFSVGSLSL